MAPAPSACAAASRSVASGLMPVIAPPAAIAPRSAAAQAGVLGARSASTWPGANPRAASVAATWSSTWAHLVGMCGWDAARYTERTVGSLLAELTRP